MSHASLDIHLNTFCKSRTKKFWKIPRKGSAVESSLDLARGLFPAVREKSVKRLLPECRGRLRNVFRKVSEIPWQPLSHFSHECLHPVYTRIFSDSFCLKTSSCLIVSRDRYIQICESEICILKSLFQNFCFLITQGLYNSLS